MSKCLNIRYRKTKLMSTQWKIDLILNMIYLQRLNLSCTIDLRTPIKSKIGGKILSRKYVKTTFYRHILVH